MLDKLANTGLPVEEFIARREKFFDLMLEDSIALFPAAKEVTRSNDTEYAFCQNKNFYYLTGFNEPDAVLVLIKPAKNGTDNNNCQALLFCLAKDPLQEVWHGRRIGQEKAQQDYGFDTAFSLDEIDALMLQYLNKKQQLLFCQGENKDFNEQIYDWLDKVRNSGKQGQKAPSALVDCSSLIAEMRLIKSESELAIMCEVNHISGLAHTRAMEKTKPTLFEYQIEAELLHEFARHGARHPAYASIVAGGDNANILHYTNNNDPLENGELLLIDAGGELAGYAADITRTFPINGKFSQEQAAIYQLVLDAQNLAIEAVKPKATFAQLNIQVNEFLTRGLHKLGILTGNLDQLINDKACKKYFIHGLGHWLGLDVHDVGDYQVNEDRQQLREFEPGMVMTIEPGLYIPILAQDVEDVSGIDKKWRGIGVRIEDNVLVTDQGHENLTKNAPKSIKEIEALMLKKNN